MLAGVQQVWCIYDNSEVDLVILIAGCGFIVTGGKKAARRYEVCLLSRSVCKFGLLYSAFVETAKSYSVAAAKSALSVHGLQPAS